MKTGWPWDEDPPQYLEKMPGGYPWPRVTIVTPTFNQAEFLEETIRSVLLQGYPDLEYMIIDGGSTDGSVDIIKKYASWLSHWESEPDRGQSHAVNKGWSRATGDVLAWLNSDDVYTPGCIYEAVKSLYEHPGSGMIYSDAIYIDEYGIAQRTFISRPPDLHYLLGEGNYIPQPTVFLKKQVLQDVGFLDENLHMVMDFDLWLKILLAGKFEVRYLRDKTFAKFRRHSSSKTVTKTRKFIEEKELLYNKIGEKQNLPREIQSLKSLFKGAISFQYAVLEAAERHPGQALNYFKNALFSNPAIIGRHPKASARLLFQALLGLFGFPGRS